jgi:hypothetical protein
VGFLIAAAFAVLAGADVHAGVITQWGLEQPAMSVDFALDAAVSSTSDATAGVSDKDRQVELAPVVELRAARFAFAHTTGGASAPTSSGPNQSIVSMAIPAVHFCSRHVPCTFRGVREHAPQLPHVPPHELLQPPRS